MAPLAPPGVGGAPGDCVVQQNSCCGACGAPTIKQVDAVNQGKTAEHQKAVCSDPNPVCPGCASAPNPDLLALRDYLHTLAYQPNPNQNLDRSMPASFEARRRRSPATTL